jgi:Uma2 family endonuclease
MPLTKPKALIDIEYEDYAREYLRRLPLEHFMEATAQAMQREITLASLALVRARRRGFHVFNELLVQYARKRCRRPGQVVPDNMVVLWDGRLLVDTCYNVPVQPVGPFWVLEYVSKSNKRKDYEANFRHYERALKVPYYLIFYPEAQELTLYRHTGKKYVSVTPDENGRCAIPELEIEVALLDGWVRFWYQGELLPLPADLQRSLEEANRRAEEAERRAERQTRRADELQQRLAEAEAELARLRAQGPRPNKGAS